MGDAVALPTIVSFYAGAQYYYDAADQLRADCARLGLACDIREVRKPEGWDWADLCRLKIPFYKQMLAEHPEGIVWVDVDTKIIRRPEFMQLAGYDIGSFLRNFKSFRDFDPALFGRRLHPGFLLFAGTERSRQFVDHLSSLERASEVKGTDDFFLEEAVRSFEGGLGIHVFNNEHIAFNDEDGEARREVAFVFGASGNVGSFVDKVEQHHAAAFEVNRERASLVRHFRMAAKHGRRDEADAIIRAALRIDPTHKDTALAAANYQIRIGKPRHALQALRGAFDMKTAPDEAQIIAIEANLMLGEARATKLSLHRLSRKRVHKDYRRSREFRLSLEERAIEMGLSEAERPALWWMEQPYPGNFGDVLNPYVVEKLSGLPPRYVPKGDGILAIGSVIKFAKAGTQVWGTGTPRMTDTLAPDADYRAVRGPLTRQLVLESGGQVPELYGDAAMLLPLIRPPVAKQYRLGFIRHYTHADEAIEVGPDVRQIDLARIGYDDIEAFIDEVNSCEAVISTSLHGLIVAHAYGVPTRRAVFSLSERQIPGDGTKFSDHYQAFGIEEMPALDLSFIPSITSAMSSECREVATRPVRYRGLLDVAPFPVLPEMLARASAFERELASDYELLQPA